VPVGRWQHIRYGPIAPTIVKVCPVISCVFKHRLLQIHCRPGGVVFSSANEECFRKKTFGETNFHGC